MISSTITDQLPLDILTTLYHTLEQSNIHPASICQFFDARGLSCPMPLLKAKVALRSVPDGGGLYLLASDKNSQTDLIAFCQKQGLLVQTWTQEDTHHFIIIKPA